MHLEEEPFIDNAFYLRPIPLTIAFVKYLRFGHIPLYGGHDVVGTRQEKRGPRRGRRSRSIPRPKPQSA